MICKFILFSIATKYIWLALDDHVQRIFIYLYYAHYIYCTLVYVMYVLFTFTALLNLFLQNEYMKSLNGNRWPSDQTCIACLLTKRMTWKMGIVEIDNMYDPTVPWLDFLSKLHLPHHLRYWVTREPRWGCCEH